MIWLDLHHCNDDSPVSVNLHHVTMMTTGEEMVAGEIRSCTWIHLVCSKSVAVRESMAEIQSRPS